MPLFTWQTVYNCDSPCQSPATASACLTDSATRGHCRVAHTRAQPAPSLWCWWVGTQPRSGRPAWTISNPDSGWDHVACHPCPMGTTSLSPLPSRRSRKLHLKEDGKLSVAVPQGASTESPHLLCRGWGPSTGCWRPVTRAPGPTALEPSRAWEPGLLGLPACEKCNFSGPAPSRESESGDPDALQALEVTQEEALQFPVRLSVFLAVLSPCCQ